jgi:hypothetical protein
MGVSTQFHASAAIPPAKRNGTHSQEAGWAPGPVWTGAENLALKGIRSSDPPARSQSSEKPQSKQQDWEESVSY